MDYWSVLASIALGVIVYPFFVMFHIVVLSWNNNPCLCIIHVPSLSVPQLFMSLGRHRWWSRRKSYSVCTGQFENGQDFCLFDLYVCWQPGPSFGVQFSQRLPSSAPRMRVKRRLSWRITSALCFAIWCPPPLPTVVISSFFQLFSHHFSINHRHSVYSHWNVILLWINYNGI